MGRIARLAAVAVSALALTGCWPAPGQNANRTAYNDVEEGISPATVGDLEEAWATPPLGLPVQAPVTSVDGVHVAVGGCAVHTVDAATGATRWSHDLFPGGLDACSSVVRYGSPPFVVGDRVLAGTFWWSGEEPSPPDLGVETAGLSTVSGATDGNWSSLVVAGVRGDTGVFVYPGLILNGLFGYEPYFREVAIGPLDGSQPLRRFRVGTALREQSWDGTVPTLGEHLLFHAGVGMLATEPGDPTTGYGVRAFSTTGSRPGCGPIVGPAYDIYVECPVWATPIDGPSAGPPVVSPDQSTVYVGTETGTLYALDARTGAVRWSASVGGAVAASPALARETLYVPTEDGRLVALASRGCGGVDVCSAAWTSEPAAGALGVQPAVAGGVVFTGAADGSVHAYDAAGCGSAMCPALWSASTGSEITGAPAVSSGQVYVGTADGRLVAYRLP